MKESSWIIFCLPVLFGFGCNLVSPNPEGDAKENNSETNFVWKYGAIVQGDTTPSIKLSK